MEERNISAFDFCVSLPNKQSTHCTQSTCCTLFHNPPSLFLPPRDPFSFNSFSHLLIRTLFLTQLYSYFCIQSSNQIKPHSCTIIPAPPHIQELTTGSCNQTQQYNSALRLAPSRIVMTCDAHMLSREVAILHGGAPQLHIYMLLDIS